MKILFVANDYNRWKNGGSVVTKRNLRFLKNISNATVTELLLTNSSKLNILKNILFGDAYGSNIELTTKFLYHLRDTDVVWFDGSLFGSWTKIAHHKGIPTVCFFHNIELIYYKARLQAHKKLQNWILLNYVKKCEQVTCQNTDYFILLNSRDAQVLKATYGKECSFILPTTFSPIPKITYNESFHDIRPFVLFVGSNFFANIEGLRWFFLNVSDKVNVEIKIVGSICDSFQQSKLSKNVKLVGLVDDLTEYYANALAVISPIFSGSGTKTKTIEALRYGKTIIGTSEAFSGVPLINNSCILCESSNDFIRAINNLSYSCGMSRNALEIFNTYFSEDTIRKKFLKFWKGLSFK